MCNETDALDYMSDFASNGATHYSHAWRTSTNLDSTHAIMASCSKH